MEIAECKAKYRIDRCSTVEKIKKRRCLDLVYSDLVEFLQYFCFYASAMLGQIECIGIII